MEERQLEILRTLYTQQQSTAHLLRERMSTIAAAAISLFIAIDGWLIANATTLQDSQVAMLIVSVLVIVGVAVYAVHARFREFNAVARLIVRIETAMKLYEVGEFLENEPLYPPEYQRLGDEEYEHGKNIFLSQASMILVFGILSVLLGILG